jgi:hypothetical protein
VDCRVETRVEILRVVATAARAHGLHRVHEPVHVGCEGDPLQRHGVGTIAVEDGADPNARLGRLGAHAAHDVGELPVHVAELVFHRARHVDEEREIERACVGRLRVRHAHHDVLSIATHRHVDADVGRAPRHLHVEQGRTAHVRRVDTGEEVPATVRAGTGLDPARLRAEREPRVAERLPLSVMSRPRRWAS